jgi:hypothetical protein
MKNDIFIGYELKTGEEVSTFLSHLVVTGITSLSGKTTTLEALIKRSGVRAVVFKTKRGEEGFSEGTIIQPFFKEKSDWQFISSLLEAVMKEKLKFERSWIIRACKGTKTLEEVYENCKKLKEESREGSLQEGVYTNLIAYFEIILPQIKDIHFSTELNLKEGINIMDLENLSIEVQSLIIRSTLDYVLNNEKGIVVIIPEAWKFIPQNRGNPVKQVAEEFIRQGATRKNFIFLDSQDIAGVDKTILKQVANWILGLQTEINEVQHTLEQIPLPKSMKPKEDEIMTLKRGHFIICNPYFTKKVYVCPAWLDNETAKKIALGIIPVEAVLGKKKIKIKDIGRTEEIALENSRRNEIEMSKFIKKLEREIDELEEDKINVELKLQKDSSLGKSQNEKLREQKKLQFKYNLLVNKIKHFAENIENVEEIEMSREVIISPSSIELSKPNKILNNVNVSHKKVLVENLPKYEKDIMLAIMQHPNIPFSRSQLALKSKKSITSTSFFYAIKKLLQLNLIEEDKENIYFRE